MSSVALKSDGVSSLAAIKIHQGAFEDHRKPKQEFSKQREKGYVPGLCDFQTLSRAEGWGPVVASEGNHWDGFFL